MNALTEIRPASLPLTDDVIDTEFGDTCIPGEMLVNYDETTFSKGDETFIDDVRDAEIVGFHIGGNVMLTRDALVAISSRDAVLGLETAYLEARRGLI